MGKDLVFKKIDLTRAEFTKLMEKVDEKLSKEHVPIFARPIRSIPEIVKQIGVNILIAPSNPIISPHIFNSHNMATHVNEWYEHKYGDRLKKDFGPGHVAVLLKGDPWKIRLPRIYGRVRLVCEPDIDKYKGLPKMRVGGPPPVLNIFLCLENMTIGFAHTLSRDERVTLMNFFTYALDSFQSLEYIESAPFVKEVFSDLNSAVAHIFASAPHYGQSKWSSSQSAEKILKCYLKTNAIEFPRNHNLVALAKLAEKSVIPNIDQNVLRQLECSPGVRYGEQTITLEEAVIAHHASIKLVRTIVGNIKK